jgi:hypothetical protein
MKRPVTAAVKRAFLEHLRDRGSFADAARRVRPHCSHPLGPASSIRAAMRADPEFAAAVEQADEEATASLISEAFRRARDGTEEPVFDREGSVKGTITKYSDFLLKFLIECRDKSYNPKRQLELSGHLSTSNMHMVIAPADLLLLDERLTANLTEILERLVEARGEQPALMEPDL